MGDAVTVCVYDSLKEIISYLSIIVVNEIPMRVLKGILNGDNLQRELDVPKLESDTFFMIFISICKAMNMGHREIKPV